MDSDNVFLVYNEKTQTSHRAIWNKEISTEYSENLKNSNQLPTPFTDQRYDNALWIYTPVHSMKTQWWIDQPGNWEQAGFDVWNPGEKETKMAHTNAQSLQSALVDYCNQKHSRLEHLKGMIKLGVFNTNQTYEEVAEKVEEYLSDDRFVCKDGANKARAYLGLAKKQWVKKELTVNEVYDNCTHKEYRTVNADGPNDHLRNAPIKQNHVGNLPGKAILIVWTEEEVA